ncbi:hypothetical protein [uncultured Paludibaculum sp.]|uniref:hypothetical protein n=1 Tax=uncultured Paludibaculum sp. TaxID=1765020 RepID=UPI002AAB9B7E|nr:hypothetical protein [uncultured Paludibaculum sp.]
MGHKATPDPGSPPAVAASGAGDVGVPNTEALEELRRILDSPEFAGSERGRTLLVYLVRNALTGGFDRLKERTIGIEIFGRDASYDTGQDAIVRVSANSVRKRLQAYYTRASGVSSVRIILPPGAYVPEFQRVVPASAPPPGLLAPAALPVPPPEVAFPHPKVWAAVVACLLLTCGVLAYKNYRLRSALPAFRPLDVLPWSAFTGHPDAGVVLTDANFTLHKYFSHREMTLPEYSSLEWLYELKAQAPGLLPLSAVPYTSVASAVSASKIGILLDRAGMTTVVRAARSMQVDDFKDDRPLILLGSAPSNPWVELVDKHMNFRVFVDVAKGIQAVINGAPKAGEPASYVPTAHNQTAGIAYAVIGLMPNLANKGPVLLVAGTNATATQAAVEFLTDLPGLREALRAHQIPPGARGSHFELLLKVDCMNSGASRSEVIASRLTP